MISISRALSPGGSRPPRATGPTGTPVGGQAAGAAALDVELHRPLRAISPLGADGCRRARVWLLVRFFTEPVGALLLDVPDDGLSRVEVAAAIDRELGAALQPRLLACGLDTLPIGGAAPAVLPPYLARRRELLRDAPAITAVVRTRNRPAQLLPCLQALAAQQYPRFRVLVVDTSPTGRQAQAVIRAADASGWIDYVEAPGAGAPVVRERAAAHAPADVLAFVDDDEIADPYWLAEVARALADHPHADAVSGSILPAELRTEPRLSSDDLCGPGRGFTPAVHPPRVAGRPGPLPSFGTGANMALRAGVAQRLGGLPHRGPTEPHALRQVLLAGGTVVHQPSALVRRVDGPGADEPAPPAGHGRPAGSARQPVWSLLNTVPTGLRTLFGGGHQPRNR